MYMQKLGEPLWLSGKVVKNEKINECERTRVRSPPQATSLKKCICKNNNLCPKSNFANVVQFSQKATRVIR
jgi:hypothetical protein